MQIHELNNRGSNKQTLTEIDLTGPGGLGQRIKTGLKTLAQPGGVRAAAQASKQSTVAATASDWADMYRRTAADQATKDWIAGLNRLWKAQAPRVAKTAPSGYQATYQAPAQPAATQAKPAPAVTVSQLSAPPKPGAPTPAEQEKLQQRIQAAMQQQLKEAVDVGAFQDWSDQQLKTRSRSGREITMDMVRRDPAIKHNLDQLLAALARAPESGAAFDRAFANYMTAATAGIRMLVQQANQRAAAQATAQATSQPGTQYTASATLPASVVKFFQAMGINTPTRQQLTNLRNLLDQEGVGKISPTGSPTLDALFREMGKL